MIIVTAKQQKEIENNASAVLSKADMMQAAGQKSAEYIANNYNITAKKIVVLCGNGGNGGDGFSAAKRLAQLGGRVSIILCCGIPQDNAAEIMYSRAVSTPVPVNDAAAEPEKSEQLIKNADIIIDAIFGIGLNAPLSGAAAAAVESANQSHAARISLDVPSGVFADDVSDNDLCFKPELTLYYVAKKFVHATKIGKQLCGRTAYIDIGIPESCYNMVGPIAAELNGGYAAGLLNRKPTYCSKVNFGRLLCAVGSSRYRGAAAICAAGAVKCGAGIVEIASCEEALAAVAAKLSEPILYDIFSNRIEVYMQHIARASAIAVGCGLSDDEDSEKLFELIMLGSSCPAVVDATGLKFASKSINLINGSSRQIVITPHEGEFAALIGSNLSGMADRIAKASAFAADVKCTVVLKGADTVIADPTGKVLINTSGNPVLAKGGSGDLLTGMIGAFLAMGISSFNAAALGTYLHGLAADIAVRSQNEYSASATDIAEYIGVAINEMWQAQ